MERAAIVSVQNRCSLADRRSETCTGNSARSQMAEALLERRSGQSIRVRGAGSHRKVLHPNAVRVMAERGIDISGCRTIAQVTREGGATDGK